MSDTVVYSVVSSGVEYILNDLTSYIQVEQDGLGMSPVRRLTEQGAQQHGASDKGFRLQPRTFRIKLTALADTEEGADAARYALLDIFKPSDAALSYQVVRNSKTRRIDCHCTGGLGFGTATRSGFKHTDVVELLAPDPVWYDPTTQSFLFSLGGGGGAFVIPLVVPMAIGASTVDITQALTYAGTWHEYPRIKITGPINDCVITNTTTDEKLDFTGYNLAAGHYIWIDLRYGHKTVTYDGLTTNLIDKLTNDSDLATWHLTPAPFAAGGVNSIHVGGTNATEATEIAFQYYERFVGV